jgi:phage head maturation protease
VSAIGVRAADTPAGSTMFGHFARFGGWTEIDSALEGPRFMEQFAPGAFAQTLAEQTPKVLFQHGHDQLGRQPLGLPREIREDNQGAYYEVDLFDGIPPLDPGWATRRRLRRELPVQRPPRGLDPVAAPFPLQP